jgi:hypothetical protein
VHKQEHQYCKADAQASAFFFAANTSDGIAVLPIQCFQLVVQLRVLIYFSTRLLCCNQTWQVRDFPDELQRQ